MQEMRVAHLQFSDMGYQIHDRSGLSVDSGRYLLDCEFQPWRLDLHGEQGANAGRVWRAICALDYDRSGTETLTFSYALEGGERPSSFAETSMTSSVASHHDETSRLFLTLSFRRLVRS